MGRVRYFVGCSIAGWIDSKNSLRPDAIDFGGLTGYHGGCEWEWALQDLERSRVCRGCVSTLSPGQPKLARPDGPVEIKYVTEVYVRFASIMELHVGEQLIKTTLEHPFYVKDKGWVKAIELERGDWLLSHEREWVMVGKTVDTGEYTSVYNLLVEEYHTYFVGSRELGISIWAHNYNLTLTGHTSSGTPRLSAGWRATHGPASNRRHHLVPQALLNDPRFMNRMNALGFTDAEVRHFVHRRIADIPNVQHISIHAQGWNSTWSAWLTAHPNFTLPQLRAQIATMMRDFGIQRSSLGGRRYGR